jgi:hypothetical protein
MAKVAMIVALAMRGTQELLKHVPDVSYARRVAVIVQEGKLVAFGDSGT